MEEIIESLAKSIMTAEKRKSDFCGWITVKEAKTIIEHINDLEEVIKSYEKTIEILRRKNK